MKYVVVGLALFLFSFQSLAERHAPEPSDSTAYSLRNNTHIYTEKQAEEIVENASALLKDMENGVVTFDDNYCWRNNCYKWTTVFGPLYDLTHQRMYKAQVHFKNRFHRHTNINGDKNKDTYERADVLKFYIYLNRNWTAALDFDMPLKEYMKLYDVFQITYGTSPIDEPQGLLIISHDLEAYDDHDVRYFRVVNPDIERIPSPDLLKESLQEYRNLRRLAPERSRQGHKRTNKKVWLSPPPKINR